MQYKARLLTDRQTNRRTD